MERGMPGENNGSDDSIDIEEWLLGTTVARKTNSVVTKVDKTREYKSRK
jgi:hypothetical protein